MTLEFRPASDAALSLRFTSGDPSVVQRWILALTQRLLAHPAPGQRSLSPGQACLLVRFHPLETTHDAVEDHLLTLLQEDLLDSRPVRQVDIPVCFDPAHAPDLEPAAALLSLSRESLIEHLSSLSLSALFLGFMPGFAYLGWLPQTLRLPRLATPRTRVPAGSFAIAAEYAGIYPAASPGGWWLLGRTPLALFNPQHAPAVTIQPGDQIRLQPISCDEFLAHSSRASA